MIRIGDLYEQFCDDLLTVWNMPYDQTPNAPRIKGRCLRSFKGVEGEYAHNGIAVLFELARNHPLQFVRIMGREALRELRVTDKQERRSKRRIGSSSTHYGSGDQT